MYRRALLIEALLCHPEMTGTRFQARFSRLDAHPDFRAVVSFREQVLFAKDFLDQDEHTDNVPKTELAKFFCCAAQQHDMLNIEGWKHGIGLQGAAFKAFRRRIPSNR